MEPDDNLAQHIIVLAALVLLTAFFTLCEVSIITLNDAKLRKMAQDGDKKAQKIAKMVDKPTKFLASIRLGVVFSGFFAAATAAHAFAGRIAGFLSGISLSVPAAYMAALVVITLVLVFVVVVFGEMVPKRLGTQFSEPVAMAVAGPLSVVFLLEGPMVFLMSAVSNGFLRLVGINPDQKLGQVTEEEIRMMIDVGNENGSIQEGEKDMINNIFEFDDRTAVEMMSHRTEIVAAEIGAPLDEIIATALESGYSRIPVYEDSLDSISGILYVKDLLGWALKSPDEPFSLEAYMREPFYVLESTSCKTLLKEFQEKKIHMAIVVDEYGGTSGLVTMEDLLEAIVGNIQDEYDDEEEDISPVGENLYEVNGLANLEDVSKFFRFEIDEEDEEDFETIGGYIVNCLGSIPGEGEHPSVQLGGVRFTVYRMEDRRISKLQAEVIKLPQPEEA